VLFPRRTSSYISIPRCPDSAPAACSRERRRPAGCSHPALSVSASSSGSCAATLVRFDVHTLMSPVGFLIISQSFYLSSFYAILLCCPVIISPAC
jgi:hypothetical protein